MNTRTRRDPLAGTRPTFMPDPDAPIDPDRRDQDLRVILDGVTLDSARTARQPFPRRRLGLAAVAAGVVTAVVIAVTPGTDAPNAPPSARDVLLAAAEAVSDTSVPTSGKYWHTRMRYEGIHTYPAGPGHDSYRLFLKGDNESWLSRTGAEKSIWVHNVGVTARPVTPADEAEWTKAGGPAVVPGPPRPSAMWRNGPNTHRIAGGPRSTEEVLGLPTDAAALKAYLLERVPDDEVGGNGDAMDVNEWLAWEAEGLLTAPATPGTRAAAYRLLADLPGFRLMEADELPPGADIGLARTAPSRWHFVVENAQLEHQLIIDPDTGSLQMTRTVVAEPGTEPRTLPAGTVLDTYTFQHAGWGDTEPVVPPEAELSESPH